MSTTTPRLGMTKATLDESMALGDNQLTDAYQKIDLAIGASQTRAAISSPYKGQLAWDTAHAFAPTGAAWVYSGTAWRYVGGWHDNRGRNANGWDGITAQQTVSTGNKLIQITTDAFQDRRYLVRYAASYRVSNTLTDGEIELYIKWAYGTNVTTSDTEIDRVNNPIYGDTLGCGFTDVRTCILEPVSVPSVNTQITIGLFADTINQNFIINPLGSLTDLDIQDIGAKYP